MGDPELSPVVPSDEELRAILGRPRTIAVVGLSPDPDRPSHGVARYLQGRGHHIIPINPNETEVLGERAYPSLREVPSEVDVDIVDVFRRAADTPPVAADAAAIGAKVLWLQQGIVSADAERIAREARLTVVMGVCIRRTDQRLASGG